MRIIDPMLQELEHEMGNTRKLLERVPDNALDFKPHEKSMPLGRLAGHITEMLDWAVDIVKNDGLDMDPTKYKPFAPKSQKELLAAFDKSLAAARTALQGAGDDVLMQPWTFKVMGKQVFQLPKVAVLRTWVFNHIIHHRGQLGVYLRLKNVPLPQTYGPSADEQGM